MTEETKQTNAVPETIKTWRNIKQKYGDSIVLIRIADNYQTFNKDAMITQQITAVEIWPCDQEEWQCSFNHYQMDRILHKLVKAGYRVAVCDKL
ncbi:MAG: hypothetical protein ABI675_25590 [Chitinophagaceae bacterium]